LESDLLGRAVPDRKPEHFVFATEIRAWMAKPVISPAELFPIPLTRPSRWKVGKPNGRQDRWLVTQHYGQDGALWTLYD
jgi:hypothetical protein